MLGAKIDKSILLQTVLDGTVVTPPIKGARAISSVLLNLCTSTEIISSPLGALKSKQESVVIEQVKTDNKKRQR